MPKSNIRRTKKNKIFGTLRKTKKRKNKKRKQMKGGFMGIPLTGKSNQGNQKILVNALCNQLNTEELQGEPRSIDGLVKALCPSNNQTAGSDMSHGKGIVSGLQEVAYKTIKTIKPVDIVSKLAKMTTYPMRTVLNKSLGLFKTHSDLPGYTDPTEVNSNLNNVDLNNVDLNELINTLKNNQQTHNSINTMSDVNNVNNTTNQSDSDNKESSNISNVSNTTSKNTSNVSNVSNKTSKNTSNVTSKNTSNVTSKNTSNISNISNTTSKNTSNVTVQKAGSFNTKKNNLKKTKRKVLNKSKKYKLTKNKK